MNISKINTGVNLYHQSAKPNISKGLAEGAHADKIEYNTKNQQNIKTNKTELSQDLITKKTGFGQSLNLLV